MEIYASTDHRKTFFSATAKYSGLRKIYYGMFTIKITQPQLGTKEGFLGQH